MIYRHPWLSDGRPDLAAEWDLEQNDKLPNEVTLGSDYIAWWRCSRDPEHSWQARVNTRALKGTGCPDCNQANRFKERIFGSLEQVC